MKTRYVLLWQLALTALLCSLISPAFGQTLPITLEITQLKCHNADEDSFFSDGDEPYLFVAAFLADGTTIHLGDMASSGAIVNGPSKTHGNLERRRGMRKGNTADIPASIGRYDMSITPVDMNGQAPAALGREMASVGIVVALMEEDSTPTSVADRGQQQLIRGLRDQLKQAISSFTQPNPAQIAKSLKKRIKRAMQAESMRSLAGILGGADPDDPIGAGYASFTYAEIASAGNDGLPITMDFRKKGVHYSLTGRVRVRR